MTYKNGQHRWQRNKSLLIICTIVLITGNWDYAETDEGSNMKSDLIELNYRQVGSPSRVQITVNESTVTISGQGGYKRPSFNRTSETPSSIWNRLIERAGKLKQGDLISLPISKSRSQTTADIRAMITIQTRSYTENSKLFSSLNAPAKVNELVDAIFRAQTLLEEIVYSENGMSESSKIIVRRHTSEIDANDNPFTGGEPHRKLVETPADYWESLITAIEDIDIVNLENMEAPTNRRSTDMSLYASLEIKLNGVWYKSKSFDDDNPPKPLHQLIKLVKLAERSSFRTAR